MECRITYVGTATFLLEIGGLRLLTDPVLDPAGSRETLRVRLLGRLGLDFPLVKLTGPALSTDELPELDAVLLSHDEHYDNLDAEGRALLQRVPLTLTTESGAKRLGGTAAGLGPWQSLEVTGGDGVTVRVTGVPALHGPRLLKRYLGDVTGFVLEWEGQRHGRSTSQGTRSSSAISPRSAGGSRSGPRSSISAAVASTTSPGPSGSA
jgi:L-ascorbate metabolism protein UlaG (beta-lactamase superfamily)